MRTYMISTASLLMAGAAIPATIPAIAQDVPVEIPPAPGTGMPVDPAPPVTPQAAPMQEAPMPEPMQNMPEEAAPPMSYPAMSSPPVSSPPTAPDTAALPMTTEQQASYDALTPEQQQALALWPGEVQAYYWTLPVPRQDLFWRLGDGDRMALSALSPEDGNAAWDMIERRAAELESSANGPDDGVSDDGSDSVFDSGSDGVSDSGPDGM